MAKSLQDQLLKAGLVDANRARKSKSDKRKQLKQQRKNKMDVTDENKLHIQKAKAEKIGRDRELNLARQRKAEQKALVAQIRQLIMLNRQELGADGNPYNFVDQGVVKTIYISNELRDQISRARLAIVKLDQKYELVPMSIAEKIRSQDPSLVIMVKAQNEQDSTDDDYADYKVPDDLMW